MRKIFLMFISLCLSASAVAQTTSAAYTEPFQRKALEIYRHIVSMRTVAGAGQVPAMARYLADQFAAGGFDRDDIHVLPFTSVDGEEIAALVVRYRGDGSSGRQPILLLAHMDVVDARREDWERDPFTLIEEDGYFFGRGSYDNKFGIASLTGTFLRLKAEGFIPDRDLIIAFSGDEETGMVTIKGLVQEFRHLTDAEFALNDDGGGGWLRPDGSAGAYYIQTAEKTYASYKLTITNPGGHSSTPRMGDNAIVHLAEVLMKLDAYRFPVMTTDATRAYLQQMSAVTPGPVGEAMQALAANAADVDAASVLWQQPELVGITRTTCVPTLLEAGHAENALPQSASVTVNCRIFPGVEVEEVRQVIAEVAQRPDLKIEVLGTPNASPPSPLREDVMVAVSNAVHARYPGIPVIPTMAPYATDGLEVRAAGIPTYGVMGLFLKDSDQFAHGLNERVPVDQFFAALDYWKMILEQLAGGTAMTNRL